MSAFIVDNDTINSILAFVEVKANRRTASYDYPARRFLEATGTDPDADPQALARLGQHLYALNVNAVAQRYPGEPVDQLPGPIAGGYTYECRLTACPSPIQAYKALACLLYQCSEGNVPQKPLYKALRALKAGIAETYIERLPEYDAAPWG